MSQSTSIYIKNMVCERCIQTVRGDLDNLGIHYRNVDLGEIEIEAPLNEETKKDLSNLLESQGFQLLESRNARLIETVKKIVRDRVLRRDSHPNWNLSQVLSDQLGQDYASISTLFSQVEGITIEKYVILQKVEKAKELLFYDELSLSEIAFQMDYSSVQHLSAQFKKITGMTPSGYRKLRKKPRRPFDKLT